MSRTTITYTAHYFCVCGILGNVLKYVVRTFGNAKEMKDFTYQNITKKPIHTIPTINPS